MLHFQLLMSRKESQLLNHKLFLLDTDLQTCFKLQILMNILLIDLLQNNHSNVRKNVEQHAAEMVEVKLVSLHVDALFHVQSWHYLHQSVTNNAKKLAAEMEVAKHVLLPVDARCHVKKNQYLMIGVIKYVKKHAVEMVGVKLVLQLVDVKCHARRMMNF